MTHDDMPANEEHLESIPWSSLIPESDNRPWLVYVAAAAVLALVVGVVAARNLTQPAFDAPGVATTLPITAPPTVPSVPSTISEADLRAEIDPADDGAQAAAIRAEWFVADYFTRDGAGGRAEELAGALGRPAPVLTSGPTTYVEWAKAWNTEPEGDGRYRVVVAFRSITATAEGYRRGLVHAVAVRVQASPDGGTRVIDLPEPAALPAAPTPVGFPDPDPVPGHIAAAAADLAVSWGEPGPISEGTRSDGAWRVVIDVADDAGIAWPMVVTVLDPDGG